MLQRARHAIEDLGARRVIALVVLLAIAFYLGSLNAQVAARTGQASAAEGAISVEVDGWTYNIPLDVVWIDELGTWHDSGRPACLQPGAIVPALRFGSVTATIDGTTWRPVVWVDCR